jgi:aerobic-type carbon monoxide dehydrogenase small subunit (CoxS/CutS family)
VTGRPTATLSIRVNGREFVLTIEPRETIAYVLRERLSLTGTKVSCDAQVCGACTVLVDGRSVSSCTILAADTEGRAIETVEGLASDGVLSPVQQAFIDAAAFQCGYCTAGMVMAATELLRDEPNPTREQVIEHLEGSICRCTGYESIVGAVLHAATLAQGTE